MDFGVILKEVLPESVHVLPKGFFVFNRDVVDPVVQFLDRLLQKHRKRNALECFQILLLVIAKGEQDLLTAGRYALSERVHLLRDLD
jgi:hypothetical protein